MRTADKKNRCKAAGNDDPFEGRNITDMRAHLVSLWRGIAYVEDDPSNLFREISCDSLDYGTFDLL